MQTELLNVTGMTCGACTGSVTNALKAVVGVGDVNVSLATGEATVQYNERLTSSAQLTLAVTAAGFGVDATNAGQKQKNKSGCCGGCC